MVNQKQSNRNVRRKVIFVFICCCAALGTAWIISKDAFTRVLSTVDNIAKPNEKMRLVSQVSKDIMQLDQLQRAQVLAYDNDTYDQFQQESKLVSQTLDSLKSLYSEENEQIKRIDSIKHLLVERDKLFKAYVQVRERLVDGHEFSEQLQTIGDILQNTPQADSTVVTSRKKIETTTIEPGDVAKIDSFSMQDDRSFFGKLFGSRKRPQIEPNVVTQPRRIVKEELNVLIDTISTARQDSAIKLIDSVLRQIEETQRAQSSSFIDREIELTYAGNLLVSKMLNILNDVENEGMLQMEDENAQARSVINHSVNRINLVVLGFFVITAVLVLLILADIRKSNRYRMELEIAKEEAEYHSAAKQRFLSNMSHELRTPLQSIIGYAEQLREENPLNSRKVNVIYQSSEHLLQIVNEILDYNRINSGKFNFNNQDFYLEQLVDEVIAAMQLQAEQKALKLIFVKDIDQNGYVYGDPFRIKQILYNLLSNAIKFTDEGTITLNVETKERGATSELYIQVNDTGRGIPQEDIHRVFNEFEQAENSNSGVHFGSGLGLSIVKTLCDAMQGTININSELGKGSIFEVYIPLKTAYPLSDKALGEDLLPIHDFTGTIWVIDDDDFILELCHNIFNKYGIDHRTFSNPEELLSTSWDPEVNILLMDMRMPGKTGIELNRELKPRIGDHVKTYAFTAQALPEEREQILAQGFDGLLLKPFKEIDLLRLLGLKKDIEETIKIRNRNDLRDFDFSNLRKMVFNDENQMLKILTIFKKDTTKDLARLRNALQANDRDQMALICHKLAGRTSQIGGQKIAIKLRKLEIDIRSNTFDILEIQSTIDQLYRLLDYLNDELHTPAINTGISS
ncbi:response regulator [Olivibacter sp. SDN3]|uniref:hybrid sensor histidine kinase/response regulator n=1 Tax=Olivibacter sp. SDN3 TaxID=2764720 RepID=UPI0016512DA0|nr:ATP-binding protein [Olivibacter sp. SDN3]QNL48429.1 response regulator [Olivibacter sp. SDN3]